MGREDREPIEEEDEGQRPRFPLPGVRAFGPEDASADEAASFGAVGAGKKMRRMIEHHRRMFPAADRAMLRRKWDEERSEALTDHQDALAELLDIERLEGVGVRGTTDRTRIITLVTRNEAGRVHKSWLPYKVLDADGFEDIKTACEKAATIGEARRKGMVVGVSQVGQSAESEDTTALRAELASLRKRLDERDAQDAAGEDPAEDGPTSVAEIKAAIADAPDDEREAVKAQFREAEEARPEAEQRKGVLEATEPATS